MFGKVKDLVFPKKSTIIWEPQWNNKHQQNPISCFGLLSFSGGLIKTMFWTNMGWTIRFPWVFGIDPKEVKVKPQPAKTVVKAFCVAALKQQIWFYKQLLRCGL